MVDISASVSGHLVDPDLRTFLRGMPDQAQLSDATLLEARQGAEAFLLSLQPPQDEADGQVVRQEIMIPGQDGRSSVRALLYRPAGAATQARPGFLAIHGGGFVMGSPEEMAAYDAGVARDHGCVVLSPAYRLAPETKHPGALEDLYACLKWFHAGGAALGIDPGSIVLGGVSAGGGLAAGLALLARDRAEISLAGQMLVYPMLDDRTATHEPAGTYAGEFLWTGADNRYGWASVLTCAPGSDAVSAYAAPARAEDLSGLPPTVILTGSLDLFIDENLAFAHRLIRQGVATGLHVYPGAYHGFDMVAKARVTRRFLRDYNEALGLLFSGHYRG